MTEPITVELGEKGRDLDGHPRTLDRRLFMQLHVFGECLDDAPAVFAVEDADRNLPGFEGVLYRDFNNPRSIGLLAVNEDPAFFAESLRALLRRAPFRELAPRSSFTMVGRTYSIGYEMNLEDVLLQRPRRRLYDPAHTWAVWYPLRRAGSFELLAREEQTEILQEHAAIGIAFSQGGHGQDIRLACHGIDADDNDFVIGLLGTELYPLSAMVQTMRKTQQTSKHLERLGPFFVGKTLWQSPPPPAPPTRRT